MADVATRMIDTAGMGADVSIRGLVKRYGPVTAVEDISLAVASGEFLSVLGPSGSGKTTVLMCLAGFEIPSAGSLHIGGREVTALPPNRREIGVIFQRYALFPHMSVRNNVRFPLKMRGMARRQADAVVEEALATVRLSGFGDRLPAQLSGGQQQRVALARAISFRPPLLLMDEPLSALDKKLREEMQAEIKDLQRRLGLTVIFVTHDQEEALTMSDRIAVMSHGRLEQVGTPEEIYGNPATSFVARFVGETNILPGIVHRRSGQDGTVALDGGGEIAVPLPAEGSVAEGSAAEVMLRPEHVAVMPAGSGVNGLAARLVGHSFAGATVALTFEAAGGQRLVARRPARELAGLAPGAEVVLVPEAGQARCFARTGEGA